MRVLEKHVIQARNSVASLSNSDSFQVSSALLSLLFFMCIFFGLLVPLLHWLSILLFAHGMHILKYILQISSLSIIHLYPKGKTSNNVHRCSFFVNMSTELISGSMGISMHIHYCPGELLFSLTLASFLTVLNKFSWPIQSMALYIFRLPSARAYCTTLLQNMLSSTLGQSCCVMLPSDLCII